MKFHDLKDSLISELHNRPFPLILIPAQVSNIVILNPGSREREIEHINSLAAANNLQNLIPMQLATTKVRETLSSDGRGIVSSRHYTVISKQKILASNHYNGILALDKKWLDGIEGEVISANHIDLRSPATAPQTDSEFNEYFDNNPLIGSHIYDGNATVWTSVQSDSDGFSRVILIDEGIDLNQAGRAVRNLLELATYRSMTLLAWPVARALLPEISDLENSLNSTGEKLKKLETLEDEQKLMTELISEASKVEKLISDNSFRFSQCKLILKLLSRD